MPHRAVTHSRRYRPAANAKRLFRRIALGFALLAAQSLSGATAATSIDTAASHAAVVDLQTGAVLLDKRASEPMPPASMSKIMTAYMIFERLKEGSLNLDDTLPVSEEAWRKGGSKMFVEVDSRVSVRDLLQGIIVQSGNDACIVVAEGLAGSEARFAEQMTARARELGLRDSRFANATGWPDPGQMMSAMDLVRLTELTIENFPEYYPIYSEKKFTYNGIEQGNRNPLLYGASGADGLKTGHTEASGYGLTGSVKRGDRRVVVVVNGLESARQRSSESERLIEWAFREFENTALFESGETVERADVWLGEAKTVALRVDQDLMVTVPRRNKDEMKVSVLYDGPVPAPIEAGQQIATLHVAVEDAETVEVPLYAAESVERLGPIGRLGAAIGQLIWGND
ncbi:MAG: D-alanyl-D-alanine carboxypeptidase [Rhodospirillaceae bacterium]|nr:D-alanyl-D-alanine carboxypeptidase [Rhodospirillaceae bacterium]